MEGLRSCQMYSAKSGTSFGTTTLLRMQKRLDLFHLPPCGNPNKTSNTGGGA